jgi:3-oxoadipate enol-lactonase
VTAGVRSGSADVADGGRLYWEEAGEGPPVVLIHAGLWDRRIWDGQMEPFAAAHRVVRYDLRGFGRSSPLERPFSARRDLADLLDVLRIERTALVGCSIGGGLAVDFALEFPTRVSALVAVCAGASGDPTEDDEATMRALEEAEALAAAGEAERALELELRVWTPPGDDPAHPGIPRRPGARAG